MLVKILKHGSGKSRGGTSAKDYLLGKDDDRINARLLKGDPDITTEIINGLKFAKTYTSGGIHFAYDEAKDLTEQDKYDIIESFEKTMFPNLEPSQVSGYWVEHTDKVNEKGERRLELNFIYANVDLESNKALPIYYHQNDKHLTSAWRDYTNIKYDLIDPLELQRHQTIKVSSNLPKHKKEMLHDIHEIITAKVADGKIKNRADIVETLQAIDGIELRGKPLKNKYISIKDPDGKNKHIRLRGAIYDDPKWTIQEFIRELERAEEADTRPKSERLREAQARLQYSVGKREERFEKRYSAVAKRSIERAERLERGSIDRLETSFFNDDETSRTARAESRNVSGEREYIGSKTGQAYRQEREIFGTVERQEFIANANTDTSTSHSNSDVERNSNYVIVSNANNALAHRKTSTVRLVDVGLDSNSISSWRFNSMGDTQQTNAGRLIDEQDTRTNNTREPETATNASTATSKRADNELQDSRATAFTELTEQIERTTNSVSEFAKQIRPSPFNRAVSKRQRANDSDRQEDDEYQYSNDRDRRTEREQSRRIESAFRQIDTSTEQASSSVQQFAKASERIVKQKEEAQQARQKPEPTPPATPSPSPSRGFRP